MRPAGSLPPAWVQGGVLALTVLVYLVAAYRPFDFVLPRRVENGFEQTASGTLVFDGHAMVRSRTAPPWLAEAIEARHLDIELEARTPDDDQSGPAILATLSGNSHERDVTVAQDDDDLVVRIRRPGANRNGDPPLVVPDVFADERWRTISVELDASRVRVRVEDEHVEEAIPAGRFFRRWRADYRLVLGNEATGETPWVGELRAVRVDAGRGEIDVLRDGGLVAPERWWVSPIEFSFWLGASDVVRNVLGFVPFGALVVVLLRPPRPLASAAVASAMLSTVMEAGQMFLPRRFPSPFDVATNTAGGMLGAALVLAALARWGPGRPRSGPHGSGESGDSTRTTRPLPLALDGPEC